MFNKEKRRVRVLEYQPGWDAQKSLTRKQAKSAVQKGTVCMAWDGKHFSALLRIQPSARRPRKAAKLAGGLCKADGIDLEVGDD